MSNNLVKAYKDGGATSGTSSHSHQSCWMSRWTQAPSKQGSLIAPHAQAFSREEGLDHKQKRLRSSLNIPSDIPRSYGAIRNNTKAETVGLAIGNLTIRAQNVGRERSDYVPFSFLGHSKNGENTWSRTPMDPIPSCSYMANSSCATCERAGPGFQPLSNYKNSGNFPLSHLSSARKDLTVSVSSDDADNPGKITVFKGHFSNNDFTSLDQGMSKCGKYSAIVVHERSGFSPLNDSKSEYFASRSGAPRPYRGRRPLEGQTCPVRNVKAMKICTTVDSAGNSHGRPPLFSQTTTRHVLFTSQTGAAHESTQNRGVKIQPLWSSTDSERDNLGDAETPRGERSFGLSAETDTMDTRALSNKNDFSGMLSSPVAKSTTREISLPMVSVAPWEDNGRGKLPVTETPDRNSMDDIEPSPSRTQSLEAEHLLSCAEQPSESKSMPRINECALQEPSSRWVKRLKLSSAEMGESLSDAKTHMFTNNSSTNPDAPLVDKHQNKETSIPAQTMVPVINGESSSRKNKNPIFQCSWIQRWCQDRSMAPVRNPSKSVVICEPNSTKLSFDMLEKKQFPSIAAVALMGRSLDGFHSCKFTKRGSLVVWNTQEY